MDSQNLPAPIHGDLETNRQLAQRADAALLRRVSRSHAEPSGEPESLLTFQFVLRALWQWWHVATPIALVLGALSAALILFFFQPVYRAGAVLQIAGHAPFIAYELREPEDKLHEFEATQIELLQSPLVLEPVVALPEIAALPEISARDNPADWLSKQVKITQVGHSELYRVYIDSIHPTSASLLVNSLLDSYFQVRANDDAVRTKRVIELLDQEKQSRALEVKKLRAKMHSLSSDLVGKDPFTGRPSAEALGRLHPLEGLRERLTTVEVERKMLEVEIQALREAIGRENVPVPGVEVEMAVDSSPEVRELRALIAAKKTLLHKVAHTAAQGKEDPSHRRLQMEIESYERALKKTAGDARPQVAEQLKSFAAIDRKDSLAKLQLKLQSQESLETMLRERYKEQVGDANVTSSRSLELEFTRAELSREERVFEMIAERSMALNTELRAPGRVSLLRRAEAPRSPVERLPIRNIAIALLASVCLPFGLALMWEFSVRRITDVGQLLQQTETPMVREVAKLPVRARIGARGGRDLNLYEESIDSLRVCLVLPEEHKHLKVFATASAIHGEGKTSIASQLAVSIARATGEPTLLIDGDMRAPDIHKIFDIPNDLGLSQVLDGRCTLEEALVTNWSPQLHLLPAGKLNKSPHKLLGGAAFPKLLEELRNRYRFIVIDTPPILSAAESLLFAKMADGVLVCTLRNYSRMSQVRMAYERLVAAGARPLGAVFNDVPSWRYASTYGSYDYVRQFD